MVHSFSLTMSVVHQREFTETNATTMLFASEITVSVPIQSYWGGGAKPSMYSELSLSLLFSQVSVKARMEAVLYSCRWFMLACSSSRLLRSERTLARITEGSGCCLHASSFSLALIPCFFFLLLVTLCLWCVEMPGLDSFFWSISSGNESVAVVRWGLNPSCSRTSLDVGIVVVVPEEVLGCPCCGR